MPKPLTVWITTSWKILKEMGIPDHPTCLLKNLYAGQEATVGTANGTMITASKASGGDGIPAELFKILKDDAVKVLHSICQQIWKTQQWPEDRKGQFSFQSQRKAMPKNTQTTA